MPPRASFPLIPTVKGLRKPSMSEMAWLGRSVPVQHEEPKDDDQSYRCDNHVCNHLRSPHSESLLRDQFERIAIVLHPPNSSMGPSLMVVTQVTWRCGCGHRQICRAEGGSCDQWRVIVLSEVTPDRQTLAPIEIRRLSEHGRRIELRDGGAKNESSSA